MLTPRKREAARLLEQVLASTGRSVDALAHLAAALGFAPPLRLDRTGRRALGIPDAIETAWIGAPAADHAGTAGLRALVLRARPEAALDGEELSRVGHAVARSSPANLWLLIVHQPERRHLAFAAPAAAGSGAVSVLRMNAGHVLDSDADTFAAVAASPANGADPAMLTHLRWREALGRDALSRRFYRELERHVSDLARTAIGSADARDRRTLALLFTSRLLFLAFLEAKGWLDGDRQFLRRHFDRTSTSATDVHQRFLKPLFFGTLNTPVRDRAPAARALGRVPFLNGGLFTPTPLERRHRALRFTDGALGELIGGLLARYRLTTREAATDWSDAAVDPEMLGRAFESLMAPADRRSHGAFYTPHALITRLTGAALTGVLDDPSAAGPTSLEALDAIRVLDPACGSGAFLVHALESLAARRLAAGDTRPEGVRRRHVLSRCIFGVDIDPTAVWLCQLRLWLSVVVDDDTSADASATPVTDPLPNLDRNIREGDALAGTGFDDDALVRPAPRLESLRLRYVRASGTRKRTLGRELDRAERANAIAMLDHALARCASTRRELLLAARSPDLFRARRGTPSTERRALDALRDESRRLRTARARLRDGGALPFSFATHFLDVRSQRRGFSLVLGNPPWVRPHAMAITPQERDALRARFVTYRDAAWQPGADAAGAGRGFASQADLAALFVERSVALLRSGGLVALVVPSKLWIALAGGGVRALLERSAPVLTLEDWSEDRTGFDAAVYPSAVIARRSAVAPSDIEVTVHQRGQAASWRTARHALGCDMTPGAPWLLLPPAARAAYGRLETAGIPLARSPLGRPTLGVKSGCNEAFVVRRLDAGDETHERVRSGAVEDVIERAALRPVIRGEHLRAWRHEGDAAPEAIVWTHDARGAVLAELPADARRWLGRWRRRLEQRTDGRARGRWWSLFRTEAARHDRPRVVWGDIGRLPRAMVLAAGDASVPLNSCYVVRARGIDEAHALAALLNSDVAVAWLDALAEPARGGYRRYLGWTCARLPVPRDWMAAVALLAPLGRAAAAGAPPAPSSLSEAVMAAFGLPAAAMSPLLAWRAERSGSSIEG